MKRPFLTTTDTGLTLTNERPGEHDPHKHDYTSLPVKVAFHHDLTLEIHGEHFSTSTKLTTADALGLINRLAYAVGEVLYVEAQRK